VQPVDGLGAGLAELVAAVDEQSHHDQVVINLHSPQPRVGWCVLRSQGNGAGVDRVGLAAVAGGEDPHLRGQLRRHVHHHLTVVH
jgi:hypothetical protein